MESLDYWRLCDGLSVFQAAILIIGYDPSECDPRYCEDPDINRKPKGYNAVKTALVSAVKSGEIKPIIYKPELCHGFDDVTEIPNTVDIEETTISVTAIKHFLSKRGVRTGFFFPDGVEADEFLDPSHSCYAPKLAAAVDAWKVVSGDGQLLNGKTPKQALLKWLREHATKYGLTDDEGKPNEQGIEEIAKVANWNLLGGAAKTPTVVSLNPPTSKKDSKTKQIVEEVDNQAIPF